MKKNYWKLLGLMTLLVGSDQVIKLCVHYHLPAEDDYRVGAGFLITHSLNNGTFFGLFQGMWTYQKLVLTLFRLVFTFSIAREVRHSLAETARFSKDLVLQTLLLSGGIGNLIDNVFYGKLLGNAATDAPSHWLHGQVIDVFGIDLPLHWIPWIGRHLGVFGLPTFNLADLYVCTGTLGLAYQIWHMPEAPLTPKITADAHTN